MRLCGVQQSIFRADRIDQSVLKFGQKSCSPAAIKIRIVGVSKHAWARQSNGARREFFDPDGRNGTCRLAEACDDPKRTSRRQR